MTKLNFLEQKKMQSSSNKQEFYLKEFVAYLNVNDKYKFELNLSSTVDKINYNGIIIMRNQIKDTVEKIYITKIYIGHPFISKKEVKNLTIEADKFKRKNVVEVESLIIVFTEDKAYMYFIDEINLEGSFDISDKTPIKKNFKVTDNQYSTYLIDSIHNRMEQLKDVNINYFDFL